MPSALHQPSTTPHQPSLTPTQQAILDHLRLFHAEYDQLPSTRAIARHFGFQSQTGAMGHINALIKKGALQRITPPHSPPTYRFPR